MRRPGFLHIFVIAALAGAPTLFVASCDDAGPLEKAGQQADQAVKDAKRAVDDATN